MKKWYIVEDEWGNEIASFKSEKERYNWLKRYCYFSGVHWLVYDLSSFPCPMTSRIVYEYEETRQKKIKNIFQKTGFYASLFYCLFSALFVTRGGFFGRTQQHAQIRRRNGDRYQTTQPKNTTKSIIFILNTFLVRYDDFLILLGKIFKCAPKTVKQNK